MRRRQLSENTSWEDAYNAVAYVADALALVGAEGDEEVGALALKVEQLLGTWEALDGERRRERRRIGHANAQVRRRDVQADVQVTLLHNDVLEHVAQERKSPLFLGLFPDPLPTVIRMSLGSELPVLRVLLTKLREPETPSALRERHEAALGRIIEQGTAAIQTREEAFAAAGRTAARMATWRDDAGNVLAGVEEALHGIAAARGYGGDWVDAFFVAVESPRKSEDKAGPPASGTP
jgi:hypothetical protein